MSDSLPSSNHPFLYSLFSSNEMSAGSSLPAHRLLVGRNTEDRIRVNLSCPLTRRLHRSGPVLNQGDHLVQCLGRSSDPVCVVITLDETYNGGEGCTSGVPYSCVPRVPSFLPIVAAPVVSPAKRHITSYRIVRALHVVSLCPTDNRFTHVQQVGCRCQCYMSHNRG